MLPRPLSVLCLVALALLLAGPAPAAPFVFHADGEPVPDLLCAFAAAQGKGCDVSPGVVGVLSGDLDFSTPDAFLAFMERGKNVVAYTDASTIYFYDKGELQTMLLTLRNTTTNGIIRALRELRAYDGRYPLLPLSGGRMVRLVAPPAYVDLVQSLVSDLEASYSAKMATRVFKLKHAWAADVTLTFMGSDTTVPGVASLLRDITSGGGGGPTASRSGGGSGYRATRLGGSGLAADGGAVSASSEASASASGPQEETSSGGRIMADPRLNAVIIWDEEQLMPMYEALIEQLDTAVPLVEIRTAVVDVNVTRVSELGVAWNVDSQSGRVGAVGGLNVGTGDNAVDFLSASGSGLNMTTIYKDGLDVFMARVMALEEDGDASILSRPAVLTLDNIQAALEVTNTFYIEVAGKDDVDLFDVTYGTILKVTPHVIPDPVTGRSLIKLMVHVEDGGSQAAPTGSGLNYPIVSKAIINTQAMVADGELLVVGGHYYESDTGGDSGVPYLKNIPVLGNLFKTNADNYKKQERLFLIAPRLVTREAVLAQKAQYGPLFERDMRSPPRVIRGGGGCGRRVPALPPPAPRVSSLPPSPVLSPGGPPRAATAGTGGIAR